MRLIAPTACLSRGIRRPGARGRRPVSAQNVRVYGPTALGGGSRFYFRFRQRSTGVQFRSDPRERQQLTEHAVRKPTQIRLELRRDRAVRDRLPEHDLNLRTRRRRLLHRRARAWRRPRSRRHGRTGPTRRAQRLGRRTIQIPRRTRITRRLPPPYRRTRPRTEQPVCPAGVETPDRKPLLDLTPRRQFQAQTLLDHRPVAAPRP